LPLDLGALARQRAAQAAASEAGANGWASWHGGR
jgi:hypothetical protein